MIEDQNASPTKIQQNFQPDLIVATVKIMGKEFPAPIGAYHRTQRVAPLMVGDGLRFENQLMTRVYQSPVQIHILEVAAVLLVVATNRLHRGLAENGSKTTQALGSRRQ